MMSNQPIEDQLRDHFVASGIGLSSSYRRVYTVCASDFVEMVKRLRARVDRDGEGDFIELTVPGGQFIVRHATVGSFEAKDELILRKRSPEDRRDYIMGAAQAGAIAPEVAREMCAAAEAQPENDLLAELRNQLRQAATSLAMMRDERACLFVNALIALKDGI